MRGGSTEEDTMSNNLWRKNISMGWRMKPFNSKVENQLRGYDLISRHAVAVMQSGQ